MEKLQTIIDKFARIILEYYNEQMKNFEFNHGKKGVVLANHLLNDGQIDALIAKAAITDVIPNEHALGECETFDALLEQCITDIRDGVVPGDESKSMGYTKRIAHMNAFLTAYRHYGQQLKNLDNYQKEDWDTLRISLLNTTKGIQNLLTSRDKQRISVGVDYISEELNSLVMSYTATRLTTLGKVVATHIPVPKPGVIQLDENKVNIESAIEEAKAEHQERQQKIAVVKHEERLTTFDESIAALNQTTKEMTTWRKAFTQKYDQQLKEQASQLELQAEQLRQIMAQNKQQQLLIEAQQQQLLESGKKQDQALSKIEDLERQLTEQNTQLQSNGSAITSLQEKTNKFSQQIQQLNSQIAVLDTSLNSLKTSLTAEGMIGSKLQSLSSDLEHLQQQLQGLSSSQKHSEATSEVELQLTTLRQQAYALHLQILPVRITSLSDRLNKLEQPSDNNLEQQEIFDSLNANLSALHSDLGVASQENDVLAAVEAKLNEIENKIVALETKAQPNEPTKLDENVTSSGNQVPQRPGMITSGGTLSGLLKMGGYPFLGSPFLMQKLVGFPAQQHTVQIADDDDEKNTSATYNG